MTCINPQHIRDIENDLKANGSSLARVMIKYPSTEARLAYFDKFLNNRGESEFLNNKIEHYILENQKSNLKEWAKRANKKGLKAGNTQDLLEKIDALKKVIDPKKDKELLNGLVKQKLGFTLTKEYARNIYDMYNTYKNNLATVMKNRPDYMSLSGEKANNILQEQLKAGSGDVLELGKSLVKLKAAYEDARLAAEEAQKYGNVANKVHLGAKKVASLLQKTAGFLKSMKATADLSAPRQLSAGIWAGDMSDMKFAKAAWKNYKNSWSLWWNTSFGKMKPEEARAVVDMMVLTRPNALNGTYRKIGVDVGLQEEAFPETWAGKKLEKFKMLPASEAAYAYATQVTRADWADMYIEQYNGDLSAMKADKVGEFVNQITGRGKLHLKWNDDTASAINALMFAPRFLAARIRTITDLQYLVTGQTKIEQERGKVALRNALMYLLIPSLIKAITRALDPDDPHGETAWERAWSVLDMRSSEFGKFRIGNTRIDASFGMGGLYTAVARGVTQTSVSSKGTKKDTTWQDVLGSFLEGKLSPGARFLKDLQSAAWGSGKGFGGEEITTLGVLGDAFIPITFQGLTDIIDVDLKEKTVNWGPSALTATIGLALDFVGVSANTYDTSSRDKGKSKEFIKEEERLAWTANRPTSDMRPAANSSLRTKLSGAKQEKAIAEFQDLYNKNVTKLIKSPKYKRMKKPEQVAALKKVREDTNKTIKKKYGLK